MIVRTDFERRWARLRQLMWQQDMAALVVSENGRSRYLTGYQRYFTATHVAPVHAVLMTLDGGPFLLRPRHVVPEPDEHAAQELIGLGLGEDARVEALGQLLHGTAAGERVGLELGFLGRNFVAKLASRLPRCQLVDADPLLRSATAVKFPDELAHIGEAARLVDEGLAAGIAACRPGASELEVAAAASARMLEMGAEFINHMTVRAGSHAAGNFPLPTYRRLAEGDCVQLDFGCVVNGYVSDTNRTVVVGRASVEQERLFEVGQRMLEAGVAAVRPGIPAAALWQACFQVAEAAGMAGRVTLPFCGHGIGLSLHEAPFVDPASTTILEENMVLALEPGVYAAGIGGSRPEDMLRITADGAELLSHFPRDATLHRARQPQPA
ncbi:MAG: aminopeptidase P family protein [Alphaproteobacteria bacterium]|nr:aminopeptidase P family protein [Alphaproteobacteria bacterium]